MAGGPVGVALPRGEGIIPELLSELPNKTRALDKSCPGRDSERDRVELGRGEGDVARKSMSSAACASSGWGVFGRPWEEDCPMLAADEEDATPWRRYDEDPGWESCDGWLVVNAVTEALLDEREMDEPPSEMDAGRVRRRDVRVAAALMSS